MSGVQLQPSRRQAGSGAALMCLARDWAPGGTRSPSLSSSGPRNRSASPGSPSFRSDAGYSDRAPRPASSGPDQRTVPFRRLRAVARRRARAERSRALHDVTRAFAVEQGQRIHQHEARDPVPHPLRRTADHHAARTGADQHDIVQVFVEQQVGDFINVGRNVDARHAAYAGVRRSHPWSAHTRCGQPHAGGSRHVARSSHLDRTRAPERTSSLPVIL